MKNLIITVILALSLGLNSSKMNAAPVGSAFSYQGDLLDSGVPANGLYDIVITAKEEQMNPSPVLAHLQFDDVLVTNGLFTIPLVDLGDSSFTGDDLWLAIGIRQAASVIGATPFTFMDTWQRVNAVPYAVQAEFLAANGANNNDVLQFDGTNWVASAVNLNSPWTDNGASVSYLGRVGVGVTNSAFSFQVKQSNANIDPIEVTDNTGVGMFRIKNNGNVGIKVINPQARLHVNTTAAIDPLRLDIGFQQKLIVNGSGNMGIGNGVSPTAKLQVEATGIQDVVNFQIDANSKFKVNTDRTYIGTDVTSLEGANGMMKYMVSAGCGSSPSIISFYTVIENPPVGGLSITGSTGSCTITFPTVINTRYIQASARTTTGDKAVTCGFHPTNSKRLVCKRFVSSTGAAANGPIMVLIY